MFFLALRFDVLDRPVWLNVMGPSTYRGSLSGWHSVLMTSFYFDVMVFYYSSCIVFMDISSFFLFSPLLLSNNECLAKMMEKKTPPLPWWDGSLVLWFFRRLDVYKYLDYDMLRYDTVMYPAGFDRLVFIDRIASDRIGDHLVLVYGCGCGCVLRGCTSRQGKGTRFVSVLYSGLEKRKMLLTNGYFIMIRWKEFYFQRLPTIMSSYPILSSPILNWVHHSFLELSIDTKFYTQ